MAKKKQSLEEALKSAPTISEELPDAGPAPEKDPLDIAAWQAAEYADIKEQIKALEKKADALKAAFEPVVKPLAKNGAWDYKGIRVRWIKVETQSVKPKDFYELTGDNGLQFLTVSVPKARKAIELGVLNITQEQLDAIASSSFYERLEAKIVSAARAAELFGLPF